MKLQGRYNAEMNMRRKLTQYSALACTFVTNLNTAKSELGKTLIHEIGTETIVVDKRDHQRL